ncbi:hypothetical protein D9757_010376 [Collybiopsis confluens]|uniref:NmrA-like domain-containing protein n=1 Tax=Collybiopsis confluens TaxID=2823264 RepID=A0A8H5LVG9_9AGAR|nr:hypothetical protein D9757_010376 [Collybiopsis confluens]
MSPSRRTIAIVGAGFIGTPIARALLNSTYDPKIIILTRPESSGKSLPIDISSIPTVPVDFTNVAAVTKVFKDHHVDIVVSTVNDTGIAIAQYRLADAAKASGTVKLFVPSEWGMPTEGAKAHGEENSFAAKDQFAKYLKSIELPFTRIYTGLFFGFIQWILGADINGKANILGQGEAKLSATSEADIGGFTAHILTALPLDSPHLVDQSLRVEGDRVSLHDLARIYEKPVVHVREGEQIPGNTEWEKTIKTALQVEVEAGRASCGWNRAIGKDEGTAGSANKLWEGHIWNKVQKP